MLCLGLAAALPLKAQDLDWAKRAGGTSGDQGTGIGTDGAGNCYVTGVAGTATFGPGEANETTLTSAGIFVAKYDLNGALVWAKRAGPGSATGIAPDGAGNSYVTGRFSGTATFGLGDPNQTTLTSAGNVDVFVANYDSSGALVWAKRAGGTGSDEAVGIAADGAGNSYVTGSFAGTATFGLGDPNATTLMTAGPNPDIFVAKYDPSGALVWAKRAGGASVDTGDAIATDGTGNSYVTGVFQSTATFGPGEANEATLTASGGDGIFVAKYDLNGALVWAKRAGPGSATGIATDGSGNSYVTGVFAGTATFGPGEATEIGLTSPGQVDIFVAKYDASGALVWAKRAGGTDTDIGRAIATEDAGDSYVTGSFTGTATFGSGESNETTLTAANAGIFDIFVAKYGSNGALVWATRAGGTSTVDGAGIATDGAGNSCVTGIFLGTATFGPGEVNETALTSAGIFDIFVARFATAETELTLSVEKDSFLRKGNPDRNEGANPGLRLQAAGDNRVVVGFDQAAIDDFGSVTTATLVLTIAEIANNWGRANDRTVDAHPLAVDFAEGNGKDAGVPTAQVTRGSGAGVTWNCAADAETANARTDCAPRWNGGTFGPPTAAPVLHVNGLSGEVSWDVTDEVLAGASAWLLKKTDERQPGRVSYHSREGANPDLAPRLILEK